jgi:hypothetical protein
MEVELEVRRKPLRYADGGEESTAAEQSSMCNGLDDDADGVVDDRSGVSGTVLIEVSMPAAAGSFHIEHDFSCGGVKSWTDYTSSCPVPNIKAKVLAGAVHRLNARPSSCIGSCSSWMAQCHTAKTPSWGPLAQPNKPTVKFDGVVGMVLDFDPNRTTIPANSCVLVHDDRGAIYASEGDTTWSTNVVCTAGLTAEWNCADGLDNDADGQTDCADKYDCADQRAPAGSPGMYCPTGP